VSAVTATNQQDHQHSAVVRGRGSNFFTAVAHATKMAYRLTKAIQEEEEVTSYIQEDNRHGEE
jgi:hypothetical protein